MNKLKGLHQSLKVLQQKLSKMKAQELHEEEGVKVKEELDDDLWFIMYQETVNVNQSFPEESFQRIFLDQQMQATTLGCLTTEVALNHQVVPKPQGTVVICLPRLVFWANLTWLQLSHKGQVWLHRGGA